MHLLRKPLQMSNIYMPARLKTHKTLVFTTSQLCLRQSGNHIVFFMTAGKKKVLLRFLEPAPVEAER